jgi:putative colanic acid biosynthesis acetyltransferase WcaF
VLRLFGSSVGKAVIVKPGVHIKYPWRLTIGDHCWIGERCWIDNMEDVTIGANAVLSQGSYLCTGNHDWSDPGMGLAPRPIVIEKGAWIGAFAKVGPGLTVRQQAVLTLGAVLLSEAEEGVIYQGNPAVAQRRRFLRRHEHMELLHDADR